MGNLQAVGSIVESIYVDELGSTLSTEDIYRILVVDIMEGAIEVDWRDFFPYLKWIPNRSMEMKIQKLYIRRKAVMKALMNEQKKRLTSGKVVFSCLITTSNRFMQIILYMIELYIIIWLFVWYVTSQEVNCYVDYLVSEAKELSEEQICMLIWETIIETSDTTLVTTEWAMYELAKDRNRQVVCLYILCVWLT